jgi:succinate dehydrogenase/fumarate reductase flavoprotein subunit
MIKTGLLVAHAALLRKESRGSHYRTDFTQRNDEEWLRNVVIRRNKDGDVDMRTEKTAQAKTR